MSPESIEPYEALAALIERELQLVSERSFDELQALREVRAELQRIMPATPPEAARAALERCRQLQKRVEIELLRVREVLLLELVQPRLRIVRRVLRPAQEHEREALELH